MRGLERLQIVRKKITELKPAPYNPRVNLKNVNKPMYDKLKHSIDTFGLVQPIIYNKRTGNIVGGHQRLDVLKENGETDIDCVEVDLNDNDEKALNVALNKVSGDWDTQMLNSLLVNFKDLEYNNIGVLGFDEKEINEILDQFREPPEENFILPKEPKYKINTGDIFLLGNHRLMCGDSTKKEDVEKLMDGMKADLLLTDPPYGINVVSSDGGSIGGSKPPTFSRIGYDAAPGFVSHFKDKKVGYNNKVVAPSYKPIIGDDKPFDPSHLLNLSEKMVIFGGNYFADKLPSSPGWIVWDKNGGKEWHDTFADAELIWTNREKHVTINRTMWKGMVKEGESGTRVHPTQKPLKLLSDLIKEFTEQGESILDCYGGSGSTLIACEQTQRKCRMMEIDPYYCSVILERWETYTNKKAEKIES